ncbi:hypothetical protein Q1695_011899 [Nippostrongylus brasiliensis]|nr:hypothetical protein Q1695_011899 [Nippostrongylus brasiliensis]
MHHLPDLTAMPNPVEFSHLANLRNLEMHNIAHSALHYNVTRLVRHLPPLRSLHIQLQESIIDEQLRDIDMTHVRHLTITGPNITNISSTAFHMLRGYRVHLSIQNTSIREFPSTLFTTLGNSLYSSRVTLCNAIVPCHG